MRFAALLFALSLLAPGISWSQDRDTKVRRDRQSFESSDFWIYNDLDRATREAKLLNKPLLIVFRCIPCEACHEFDEQVAERDPVVRDAMNEYVCLRIVQGNGLDLTQFQFDFDQSFAITLMHADGTILGRFGTRSNRDNEAQDISLDGLKQALAGGLKLHQTYSAIKHSLSGKQVAGAQYRRPEDYPHLSGRYDSKLNYEQNVAQSCIHCHQIGEAQRLVYRSAGEPIPDQVLFPHPNPRVLGLWMDPKEMATVQSVAAGSSAERDGFRPGDRILTLEKQPLLSTADFQWVLHHAPMSGELRAEVSREGKTLELPLTLSPGWRHGDISWRATTWDLRRMALGGMVLEEMPAELRATHGIKDGRMALLVKHVGKYGEHAVAKNAGVQAGDVVVGFDGLQKPMTETELLAYGVQQKQPGDMVSLTVLRNGQEKSLQFRLQ